MADEITNGIEPWAESFRVRSYECATDGRLSLPSLANYLQEIAGNHARELGLALGQLGRLTWVLYRLRIETSRRPDWSETVTVLTWPSGHNGMAANREYLVKRKDGEVCAKGSSQWFLFDLDRRRPVRLPDEVTTLRTPDLARPLGDLESEKIEAVDEHMRIVVRQSDLDINGHVNHVRYLQWMMDTLDTEAQPTGVDLTFKAEALLGDSIAVYGGAEERTRLVTRDGRALTTGRFLL